MCGRFVQFSSLRTIADHFQIDPLGGELTASYNIAPTQAIFAVIYQNGRRLKQFHWGLVPFWSKDLSGASRLINARAETVAQKPSFRTAFKRRRCLILSNGYYEWQGVKGNKQPYYMFLPDQQPMAFAGLWETWQPGNPGDDQATYSSCTIITREASSSVRDIHHRMPVILKPEAYDRWLNPEIQQSDYLQNIIDTEYIRKLKYFPVSKMVNRVQNNTPECIEPLQNQAK